MTFLQKSISNLTFLLLLSHFLYLAQASSFSCDEFDDDLIDLEDSCSTSDEEQVCAITKPGVVMCGQNQCKFTFINYCEACKVKQIIDFMALGACEKYPPNAIFCSPFSRLSDCSLQISEKNIEIKEVCGFFNLNTKCNLNSCFQVYSSSCEACSHQLVDFYVQNECPSSFNMFK